MLALLTRVPVLWIAVFSLAVNLLMLVPPIHMLTVYDRVLPSQSVETLLYVTLIAVFALMLYGVAEAVRGIVAQRGAGRFVAAKGEALVEALSAPGVASPVALERMRDFTQLRGFYGSRVFVGLFDLPYVPLFVGLMFLLHWSLGLLTIAGVVVLVALAGLNRVVTASSSKEAREKDGEAARHIQGVWSRAEDARASGQFDVAKQRWGEALAASLVAADRSAVSGGTVQSVSKAMRRVLQVVVMAWGAWLVLQGSLSAGAIFAASMIVGRALQPVDQVIGGWERIAEARRAHAALGEWLDAAPRRETFAQPEPAGHLSAEGLVFAPHGGTLAPVLGGVSLAVTPGEVVALIGSSGSGKSVLARMLAGAMTPQRGAVRLDRAERAQWPDPQWAGAVGYLPQDVALPVGTVAQAIARLDDGTNETAIVAAAKAAGVHEMILALPQGYSTLLGPGRFMPSAGQRARLGLGRALYGDPKVLVLDEPTAHVDQAGETALRSVIEAAKARGATVVVVTQRRSVLSMATRTLMLRDGRLAPFDAGPPRQVVTPPAIAPTMAAMTDKTKGQTA